MTTRPARLLALAAVVLMATPASAQPLTARERHALTRFEAALAAQPSATRVLQDWCSERHLADPAEIKARVDYPDEAWPQRQEPPADVRSSLSMPAPGEPGFREVTLMCGDAVLSQAVNWFNPTLLTERMLWDLHNTQKPFGRVVEALHFQREPLSSQHGSGAAICVPGTVLTHKALLRLPDGRPLAYVIECYQPDVVARPGLIRREPIPPPPPSQAPAPSLPSTP